MATGMCHCPFLVASITRASLVTQKSLGTTSPINDITGAKCVPESNQKEADFPSPISRQIKSSKICFSCNMLLTVFEKRFESSINQKIFLVKTFPSNQATHKEPALAKKFHICFKRKMTWKSSNNRMPKPPSTFGLYTSFHATRAPEADAILFFHKKAEHSESTLV